MIFEEVAAGSVYVGGASHEKFVRFKIDHMARTMPGPVIREWWVKAVDKLIAPYVKDRGYDWEVTIDELPADLWSIQGANSAAIRIPRRKKMGQGEPPEFV